MASCSRWRAGSAWTMEADAMSDLVLRRVRRWPREVGGPEVDVVLRGGRIAEIVADAAVAGDSLVVDCAGGLLMPAFADVHTHLDSTRLGLPFKPHTAGPGLTGLIENDRRNWRSDGNV